MRYQKFYKVKQLALYKIAPICEYGDLVGCRTEKKRSVMVLRRT